MPTVQERQGQLIRQARTKRGWSQKLLAEKIGMSEASICNIENGRHGRGAREPTLRLICFTLQISPRNLLAIEDDK